MLAQGGAQIPQHLRQDLWVKQSRFSDLKALPNQPSPRHTAGLRSSRAFAESMESSTVRIGALRPQKPGISGSAGEGEPNEKIQGSGGGGRSLSYGGQWVGFMVIGKNLR